MLHTGWISVLWERVFGGCFWGSLYLWPPEPYLVTYCPFKCVFFLFCPYPQLQDCNFLPWYLNHILSFPFCHSGKYSALGHELLGGFIIPKLLTLGSIFPPAPAKAANAAYILLFEITIWANTTRYRHYFCWVFG